MKKLLIIAFTVLLAMNVSACTSDDPPITPKVTETGQTSDNNDNNGGDDNTGNQTENKGMKLRIKVGSETFSATLANNETAKAFRAMLPITINMAEHAGNEKYYDLPNSLPTAAFSSGTIRNGDIMLFGSRTLVLFYKSFSTSYSYSRIGVIDNASGLESALGAGRITVVFEIVEE
ncbi:cyclophilin-like fold protein [Dysgonomonas sp. ZJ709]|uniref:cyclophilin-like fold protein n=1 Tax=Dysgonomonas sp. ZJ709 TaxID=2709797 RepID=UPI0013EC1C99|nr:cyclophilin-like fold protein [Dysgonomonas sp. ZJ709]